MQAQLNLKEHLAELHDLRSKSGLNSAQDNLHRVTELLETWKKDSAEPEIQARRKSLQGAVALVSDGQGKRQLEEVRRVLNVMQENETGRQLRAIAESNAALQTVRVITLLGLLMSAALTLLVAWRAAHTVQANAEFLNAGAQQIATGNYDLRLPKMGVQELDTLSAQFHQMAEAVQRREQELAESSRALQHRTEELERSNRELERFAYIASHDLQEPLRTIGSYTELLGKRYRGQLDARADQYIDFTISATQRLKNLIQDLLAFSRVHRPGRTFSAVNTAELTGQILQELEAKIKNAGATVTFGELPTVRGNAELLHHVFLNLMTNAIKFRSPERPSEVRVWAERGTDGWVFHVQDNGIGIDSQYFDKIFGVFQRLHGIGTYEGSGIGLAVTRSAVEQHGGKIWLHSTPGVGSTFSFTLPDFSPEEKQSA